VARESRKRRRINKLHPVARHGMGLALFGTQKINPWSEDREGASMSTFTVTRIIDGDTFDVTPQWKWNGQTGSRVRPTGYNAPEMGTYGGQAAKDKLSNLVLGKAVELGSAYKVDRGRLVCDVYYRGRNLADYFSGYW